VTRLWAVRNPPVVATIIIRESGGPSVVVMKPIQYRNRSDLSCSICRDCPLSRRYPLTDSLVRSRCVEVRINVVAEHASQMVCAENIGAFGDSVECRTVLRVAVPVARKSKSASAQSSSSEAKLGYIIRRAIDGARPSRMRKRRCSIGAVPQSSG
jgi:hypothetical protein